MSHLRNEINRPRGQIKTGSEGETEHGRFLQRFLSYITKRKDMPGELGHWRLFQRNVRGELGTSGD